MRVQRRDKEAAIGSGRMAAAHGIGLRKNAAIQNRKKRMMNNDLACRTDRYNTFIPERKMEIHKCAGVR